MGALSLSLNAVGLILLSHAVYSAHEYTALLTLSGRHVPLETGGAGIPTVSAINAHPHPALPLDIVLETLVAVLLLCTGIVAGSPSLKPIRWREWAGKLEREGPPAGGRKKGDLGSTRNPFRLLEDRQGFLDIRARRKEFADWVRAGGKA